MLLHEKWRPREWSEFVGQDKAKAQAIRLVERAKSQGGPVQVWIDASGEANSGLGKTTLARLIAGALADPFFTDEFVGSDLTLTRVREIAQAAHLCTSGAKRFRAWIVNEAHAVPAPARDLLLDLLENAPEHFCIVFTTTRQPDSGLFGEDNGPFYSRCSRIRLTNQGLAQAFADRARMIAQTEGLDGQPLEAYVKLARDCRNNMRAMIQRIDDGVMIDGGA